MKRALIDVGHFRFTVELDFRDLEPFADFVDVHRRGRMHALRLKSRASEAGGKRHRETARVRRADQLLRIGSLAVFESRSERVAALERSAAEFDAAGTFAKIPFPLGFRFSQWHISLLRRRR